VNARAIASALAIALMLAAFFALRPPAAPGAGARDFQAYLAAGAAYDAHTDPYGAQIARYEPELAGLPGAMLPFVGTPASLPWWGGFARMDASTAIALWDALLILSLGALAYAGWRLCGGATRSSFVAVLCVTAAFAPVDASIALGQTALPAVACMTLAVALDGAALAALVALGTAAAFALQPNLAVALAFGMRGTRKRVAALAGLALFAAASLAVAGAGGLLRYQHLLAQHAAAERGSAVQFGAPLAFGIVALLAAIWIAWRSRDARLGFGALACGLPFVVGFFHPQDFVVVLPAALLAIRRAPKAWAGVAAVATLACGAAWLDAAQHHAALAQDAVLATALLCGIYALRPLHLIAMLFAAALMVTAFAVAVHGHVPVWPDAMHPFHVPPGTTAPAQWHLELLRSGLLTRNATSAALRAISLAGCAALVLVLGRIALDVDVHHVVER
jgi:hypothetical protein